MYHIERAIFDIRRGLPVVLNTGEKRLLVQALEGIESVDMLAKLAGTRPSLVLTRHRLEAMGMSLTAEAACLPLVEHVNEDDLQALAVVQTASRPAHSLLSGLKLAGPGERGAVALLRRALLIPAALCADVSDQVAESVAQEIAQGKLLEVDARDAAKCLAGAPGMLKRVSEARIPLEDAAESRFVLFREPDGLREHVAVVIGQPETLEGAVPLRLHSACLTGDLFGSLRCDCGEQLRNAVADIQAMGGGVLLYLAQEGRGIGLANKLRAYTLQDGGLDTMDADQVLGFGDDERQYAVAVDMLNALKISQVQLLTNNPLKIAALREGGIEVVSRQALYGSVTDQNHRYLSAKANRAGHLFGDVLGRHGR
ncbi:3,4-dihydroxy-2-butanone 4-phosphate synthase / GTP cyclohydrolase II [Halomonas citrativorans]|uniref:GTP cyclohydrolase-2 n=1 Tax=Halomonas citrativorans TaxID=2742612 RepID=A0A1R4I2K2_9GAMM|nr:GTP cyclohydrolase II RibA [Halomonas citrativorans]SJN14030.1 3,4-dihydroxy-2-butanone 4-phosphate synthase / GTP cyclohydrolase II [Halomonas citrativorans]